MLFVTVFKKHKRFKILNTFKENTLNHHSIFSFWGPFMLWQKALFKLPHQRHYKPPQFHIIWTLTLRN